jgi:hypothetical protein
MLEEIADQLRMRYEYCIESRPPSSDPQATNRVMVGAELQSWLNEYGSHGWELCAVYEDKYGWSEFFFKREIV